MAGNFPGEINNDSLVSKEGQWSPALPKVFDERSLENAPVLNLQEFLKGEYSGAGPGRAIVRCIEILDLSSQRLLRTGPCERKNVAIYTLFHRVALCKSEWGSCQQ